MECEVCGQQSEDGFEVVRHVGKHTFDTFECAIYAMAPVCAHCSVRVIGHPVKEDDHTFCCAHCADAGPSQSASDSQAESDEPESGEAESGDDDADEGEDEDEDGDEEEDDEEEDEEDGEEEGEEEGEEGDQPSEEDLKKLDERISQARQSSEDLLSGPEDAEEEGDAEAETEANQGGDSNEEGGGDSDDGEDGDKG